MDSRLQLLLRMHAHRLWTLDRLLRSADQVSQTQMHLEFPIGQGSLWRTLVHLIAAEHVWLETLQGNESPVFPGDVPNALPGNQQGEGTLKDLAELEQLWGLLQQRWQEFLDGLADKDLDRLITKVSTSSKHGQRLATKLSDILIHLCTHAQYTAAQAVNILRQLRVENLPDVMMITMAREELTA